MNIASVLKSRDVLIGKKLKTYWPTGKTRDASFVVVDINDSGAIIRPERSGKDRRIPAQDINRVGESWNDCKSGAVSRADLADGSSPKIFHTSYIGSIFNQVEHDASETHQSC